MSDLPPPLLDPSVDRLKRRLARETRAREQAEALLEQKSNELFGALEQLQAQTSRVRALALCIDAMNDGIATTDAHGNFTYMNAAHAAMFDYSIEEIAGNHWSVLYRPAEQELFQTSIFPALAKNGHWRGETTGVSKNGDSVHQEIALTLHADGSLTCATRDIRERRRREFEMRELEARLRKAEHEAALFAVGNAVAHDFNNLIAAISGNALLLQSDLQNDETNRSRAERILSAAQQATGVVRSLEIERYDEMRSVKQVDLAAIARTGVSIASAIRPQGIDLKTDIPDFAWVTTNEVTLSRGLLNIAKNAFEAMGQQGELSLRISKTPSPCMGQSSSVYRLGKPVSDPVWIMEITDTGPGISFSKLEKIFEPFVTTKASTRGSGLGLMSLKALADGGTATIEVETEPGEGTRFRIVFPTIENRIAAPSQHFERACVGSAEGLRILIVDDERMIGEMLVETLERLGYEAFWIEDAHEALSILESTALSIDLLLTDFTMPKIKGDALALAARACHPSLPIILYSGQADYLPDDPIYSAVLTKPIDPEGLDRAIRRAIDTQDR